jgi:hypothetical protein
MPHLSHEQRQRLFNYFAEAHDLLLPEDDFKMIDDMVFSQNSGHPLVSGSLPCRHNFIQKDTYWKSCTHCGMLAPLGQ